MTFSLLLFPLLPRLLTSVWSAWLSQWYPSAVVLISAFNNEWKDTIRQSLQSHVARIAQGQDSGSCQRGWWLAETGVWKISGHMHHTYTQREAARLRYRGKRKRCCFYEDRDMTSDLHIKILDPPKLLAGRRPERGSEELSEKDKYKERLNHFSGLISSKGHRSFLSKVTHTHIPGKQVA